MRVQAQDLCLKLHYKYKNLNQQKQIPRLTLNLIFQDSNYNQKTISHNKAIRIYQYLIQNAL